MNRFLRKTLLFIFSPFVLQCFFKCIQRSHLESESELSDPDGMGAQQHVSETEFLRIPERLNVKVIGLEVYSPQDFLPGTCSSMCCPKILLLNAGPPHLCHPVSTCSICSLTWSCSWCHSAPLTGAQDQLPPSPH